MKQVTLNPEQTVALIETLEHFLLVMSWGGLGSSTGNTKSEQSKGFQEIWDKVFNLKYDLVEESGYVGPLATWTQKEEKIK
jgi:hypothetical protein